MDLAECCRQANGHAQDASQIERLPLVPLKNLIQGFTARVLEYEDRTPFVTSERQRLSCPRGIEFGRERVFVLEPPETLSRRLFRGECDRQDWRGVAMLPAAVKREVRTFPDGLQHVPEKARSWRAYSSPRLYERHNSHFDSFWTFPDFRIAISHPAATCLRR